MAATRSTVRLLVSATTVVSLDNLGLHMAKVKDRRVRPALPRPSPAITVTGDVHSGTLKVLRPRY
jgi:hypothetical protein